MSATADGAFLARLGGDEFTIIVTEGAQPDRPREARRAAAGRDRRRDRDRRPALAHRPQHRRRDLPDRRRRRAPPARQRRRRALSRQGEGRGTIRFFEADMDQRLRERRALQHELRSAHRARRASAALSAAGADRRRDHRLRGAGPLASSDARPCLARHIHPARRGERARSCRSANGCCARPAARPRPGRSRCRSPSTCRRSSSATATCRGSCMRCCSRPGLPPAGSSSRSPKAC